jgi:hypothetical protein
MRKVQPVGYPLSVVTSGSGNLPVPPRELGEHGQRLWDRVQAEYAITDSGGVEILYQAAAATDLAETLADTIKNEGPMVQTKFTRRTHPAVRELIQVRAFVCRALGQLGLHVEPVRPVGRPPRGGLGWRPED